MNCIHARQTWHKKSEAVILSKICVNILQSGAEQSGSGGNGGLVEIRPPRFSFARPIYFEAKFNTSFYGEVEFRPEANTEFWGEYF